MVMNTNVPVTELVTLVGAIDPQDGSGELNTGWVDFSLFQAMMAVISAGAVTSVDAKLEQATDETGAGLKDVTGKSLTTFSDDNSQGIINIQHGDMDMQSDYRFVRLTVTATGRVSANLFGVLAAYGPASKETAMSLIEVV